MKLKWILTGFAAVVVAVLVAVYAVLSSMDFEGLRGVIEAEAKKATGRDLRIAGPIDLQISRNPAITVEEVSFANAPWGSRAEMVSVKRFELEVSLLPLLSGEIKVGRLILVQPDILLETDPEGRGNWEIAVAAEGEAGAADAGAATLPSFDQVLIRGGRLLYRDGKTGTETRLHLSELVGRAAGGASPIRIAVEGRYNDTAFTAEGVLGSFEQLLGEGAYPVQLTAEAGGASLEIEGSIAEPMAGRGIDLRLAARGRNLADLSALTGGALPPLGPYALGAEVKQTGQSYKLTGLTAKIGGSDFAGNATLSLAGRRPALKGTFTAGVLDLADFVSQEEGEDRSEAESGGDQKFVFAADPLPLDGLKAVDAELKLSAGRLRLPEHVDLSDLELSLTLESGRLAVQSLTAGFAGGRLAGDLSLDAGRKTPQLSLNLTAKGVDYGRLLKDMAVTDGVVGSLDGSAGLRGAGASLRAIASSLNGRVEVVGGEGVIRDDLLAAAGAGLLRMLSGWREGGRDLRLNCVVARLPVQGGVMTGEAILLDTAAVTVGGEGSLDLRGETLDLRVTPQAKQASLMSLAVPFRVSGTLASPAIGPDPVGTAVGAARIAGLFINPLAAGAVLFAESETAEQNPCLAALEQVAWAPAAVGAEPEETTVIEDAAAGVSETLKGVGAGVGETLEGVGEGITKGLRSLFGD
ncbi:MAG: AsmA family protein [Kiloniellaceae bacterium]